MFYSELIKIPFLRILLPLLAGILVQEKVKAELYVILPAIILFCILILLQHNLVKDIKKKNSSIFGLLVFVVLFLSGMGLLPENITSSEPEKTRLGRVAIIPLEKEKTFKIILNRLWEPGETGWYPVKGRALLYIEKSVRMDSVKPGDLLIFYCPLEQVESPANPMEFDYRRYCSVHGIFWRGYLNDNQWKRLGGRKKVHIIYGAERIRMMLLRLIDNYDFHHKDLVASLLLGYRENLSEQQKLEFMHSGAMHILAVSGLHVGIIYGILFFLIKPFFRKKSGLLFFIIVTCIWFYAILTGLTPSVTRASLMLSLYMISRFIKRKSSLINILFFSAFLMTLFNPVIVFRVSFQLSFMAVTGISIVFQELYAFLRTNNWLINKLLGLTCLSFSAQLFTFPLSLYYFHQFPHYFLVTNLFVIPLTVLILYSGCMFFLFSFFRPLSSFFAGILDMLTSTLQWLTSLISSLPFSSTNDISIDTLDVILIYMALISLTGFIRKRSVIALFIALSVIAITAVKNCCGEIIQHNQKKFLVCSVEGSTVLNFISGYQNIVMTNDTGSINCEKINYHMNLYWISTGVNEPEYFDLNNYPSGLIVHPGIIRPGGELDCMMFIQFSSTKIGVLSEPPDLNGRQPVPLKLDILIIDALQPVNLAELFQYIQPGIIIIDRRVPHWLIMKMESECSRLRIPYHSISSMGHYMIKP